MNGRLQSKVAVVTGAGKGIGRAIAERFGHEGAKVVCADIDDGLAAAVAATIKANGGDAVSVQCNVADVASVSRLVESSVHAFERVDIVCNNAGILDGFTPLGEVSDELWNRVLGVNLTGPFYVSRAFLPVMLEQGGGVFVNLASMAGLIAHAGGLAYTVSKHGVIGLTRQISADYGPRGIRANAICPGSIDTEMSRNILDASPEIMAIATSVPAARLGKPEEIAELATYLASDASGFVHGAAMVIDGGWTIR